MEQKLEIIEQALIDIINPISKMRRELEPGEQLNSFYASQMANNTYYLQSIAKDALEEINNLKRNKNVLD